MLKKKLYTFGMAMTALGLLFIIYYLIWNLALTNPFIGYPLGVSMTGLIIAVMTVDARKKLTKGS